MTTRAKVLLHEVLGCPGRMPGPVNLVEQTRLVLDEIGAAWRARLASAGSPAPRYVTIRVSPSARGSDEASGVTRRTRGGFAIDITVSDPVPVARLRHCLAHELGHVLVGQSVPAGTPTGGIASEYAAERLGWEIVLAAGLRPHLDVFARPEREDQRAWLRPLVAIATRLQSASREERLRPDDGPYGRDLGWLFAASRNLARAEAYRRGQADAGIAVEEPRLPAMLEAALDDLFAPISERVLPVNADRDALREFVTATASALFDRHVRFGARNLQAIAIEGSSEFLRLAPPRAA